MRPVRRRMRSALAIVSLIGASPALAASANSFTGALNNDWSNAGNWSSGRSPGPSGISIIDRLPQLWLGAKPGTAGSLYIGLARTGSLYAETALSLTNLTLGGRAGANGSLVMLGSAGRLTAKGTVAIGQSGRGEIDLYRAASLRSLNMTLGSAKTGSGTLVVSGQSLASVTGTFTLGSAGRGRLDLNGAGRVSAGTAVLGALGGGSGTAVISGSGTTFNAGSLLVGRAGAGAITVTTGATLSARTLTLGMERTGRGTLKLSGGGTKLAVSGLLSVGGTGSGTLTAYTGAAISAAGLVVGGNPGSTGTFIGGNGGTVVNVAGELAVGAGGRGSFTLQDGAIGKAGRLVLGRDAAGSGSVTLSATNTSLATASPVEIGRSGSGTMTLTGGARLSAPAIDLAVNAGSSGTLAIGALHGAIARGAGSFDASAIRFGAGNGTLVFNFGGPTYTTGARISGGGTILADAGAVNLKGDSSAFTGTTRITGGMLSVNGTLGGSIAVSRYGTLGGTGSVGSVDVSSGGTLAPAGSGTGTLSINGNLSIGSGGHVQTSVAPQRNAADRIEVSGQTTIASGAVLDVVQESAVALERQDVILRSGGGVTGRFDTITSNYAFITPTVSNDGHNLLLTLRRNGVGFASAAVDPGARTVAAIGDDLAADNPLYRQIVSLSASQAGQTFGDLAGTIHASPALNAFDVGRFARNAALERATLPDADDTPAASAMTAWMDPGPDDAARAFAAVLADEKARGPVGWARAYGGYSTRSEEAGDRIGSTGGMLFGWDSAVSDHLRLGILGGIGIGHVRESARLASADSRDYTLGLYGGTEGGPLSLRFGATYVHQDIDTDRTARFNGFAENLAASYGADAVQTYGEIGHRFDLGDTAVEPFANLSLTWQRTQGFAETGGNGALTATAAESTQAETVIGLRASHAIDILGETGRVRGMLGWNHAFAASGEGPLFSFAGSEAFSLKGAQTESDSLAVEAGLDLLTDEGRTNLGLTYGGNFAANAQSHLVKLTLSRQF